MVVAGGWGSAWRVDGELPGLCAAAVASGTYYSPETNLETQDAAALGSAHKTIGLAAFSLTDEAIVKVLADRAAHGVEVFIYLDRRELQANAGRCNLRADSAATSQMSPVVLRASLVPRSWRTHPAPGRIDAIAFQVHQKLWIA